MGVRNGCTPPAAGARLAARDHEGRRRRHRRGQSFARRREAHERPDCHDRRRKEDGSGIERRPGHASMTRRTAARFALPLIAALTLSIAPVAQRRGGGPPPPSRPTPHYPDGRVNLGPPPGEKGIWNPPGIVQLSLNPKSVNPANPGSHLPDNITLEAVPFQPWARALHAARQ